MYYLIVRLIVVIVGIYYFVKAQNELKKREFNGESVGEPSLKAIKYTSMTLIMLILSLALWWLS